MTSDEETAVGLPVQKKSPSPQDRRPRSRARTKSTISTVESSICEPKYERLVEFVRRLCARRSGRLHIWIVCSNKVCTCLFSAASRLKLRRVPRESCLTLPSRASNRFKSCSLGSNAGQQIDPSILLEDRPRILLMGLKRCVPFVLMNSARRVSVMFLSPNRHVADTRIFSWFPVVWLPQKRQDEHSKSGV